MLRLSRICLLAALAAGALMAQPLLAVEEIQGNLVDVAWVRSYLANPDVLFLDVSPPQLYAAGHIPGAINANLLAYGARELPIAEMEKLFQSWGVSPGKKIVLYDQGGTILATRLFFSLYYYGFPAKDLLVLDGGLSKWREQDLPLAKDVTPLPGGGSFTIKTLAEDARVERPEFLTASGDPANNVLLEALGADWHFGQVRLFDRAGHIPNGILLPSADFYNPDKTFKSAQEIARMLRYLGIRPEQQIFTYCGGGVAASVPFFALKFIVKYPKVKLYTGSEMDWLADERGLPYWTYDAPFLMRETGWLQFWGGKTVRMYRGADVSMVDVRPAAAFQQGHVPFAMNVPADRFKANVGDPRKLAEILALAGVDAAHEAVVISGAGLTPDAALAFVMLEQLGQKKVSVLMDSMGRWAQLGFPLAQEAAEDPQNALPGALASLYAGNFRQDVIIADPATTQGLYPKVFLASGKNLPGRSLEGTVVHVPYTELLNENGRPKAAKDIWEILVKAGVPRYAELVCFSDDPGEAAANYFVLKLMGFPDVKLLVN